MAIIVKDLCNILALCSVDLSPFSVQNYHFNFSTILVIGFLNYAEIDSLERDIHEL